MNKTPPLTIRRLAEKAKVTRFKAAQALKLANEAPALAADVARGKLTLEDAMKQLQARHRRRRH